MVPIAGSTIVDYACQNTSTQSFTPTLSLGGLDDIRSAFKGFTVTFHSTHSGQSTYFWFGESYATRTFPSAANKTASPLDYLNSISSDAPSCANSLNTTCPQLFSASKSCWSQAFPPGPQSCYCSMLTTSNCTSLCQGSPKDRNRYFEWVMNLCNARNLTTGDNNSTTVNFTTHWVEYANRSTGVDEDLLLWSWRLQSRYVKTMSSNSTANLTNSALSTLLTQNSTCPLSSAKKLYPFAITNAITAGLTPLARRGIFDHLSRAYFGRPGARTWLFTALLAVCLNLIATAISVRIALSARGYSAAENITAPSSNELFLFWLARPRTAWIVSLLINISKEKISYLAAAASAVLAETLQQIIGAVVFFNTIKIAAERGYMGIGALRFARSGSWATAMYFESVVWVLGCVVLLVFVIRIGQKCRKRRPPSPTIGFGVERTSWQGESRPNLAQQHQAPQDLGLGQVMNHQNQTLVEQRPLVRYGEAAYDMGLSVEISRSLKKFTLWILLAFVMQWAFWVAWVKLAGDR